jgi:hypothetical protein
MAPAVRKTMPPFSQATPKLFANEVIYEKGTSKTIGEKNHQPIDKPADGRNKISSEGW